MFRARQISAAGIRKLMPAFAVLLAVALSVSGASAQNLFAPVAKVNDDVITGYDVIQRSALLKFSSSRSIADVERMALDQLVADSLKIQEAKRLGFTMDDSSMSKAVEQVAQNNRMTMPSLTDALKRAGIEMSTLQRQVEADVLWRQVISQRYGDRLRPSEGEVETAMGDAAPVNGPKIYDVRQLVLPLAPNAPLPVVKKTFEDAASLKQSLNSCQELMKLAPKYHRISGEVGKITAEQMPGPIREEVLKLGANGVTKPMRSRDGVHLVMLCGIVQPQQASRSQVFNRLVEEKGQRFSDSYLAELRRDALIESRK